MMFHPGVPASAHVQVSGNSIYANAEIGIDLMPNTWDFGSTPNDAADADLGANGLQNFPVVTAATTTGASISIEGTLTSHANQQFSLEFFASDSCDPSGFGQGQTYLGSSSVTTNASGDATFSVSLSASVSPGSVVTSTATRVTTGDTSEFSACTTVDSGSCPADLAEPSGQLDFSDVVAFLAMFSASDPRADMAEPFGQLDFSDVVAFLAAFGDGCP